MASAPQASAPMVGGPRTRAPRADARRNVERLLTAADAAFARHGTNAALERIARDAGVAIGTLYGHFPSRNALITALLRTRHDALFALGESLLAKPGSAEPDAAEALGHWVRTVAEHAATYGGLADVLTSSLGDEGSEMHTDCARITELTERLTHAARSAGALRSEVSTDDLITLISAAAWVREQLSPTRSERLIRFALEGLRAR